MGVSSKKLVYDFKRKADLTLSNGSKGMKTIDMIAYINEAYELWFENMVKIAETNSKVRNNLRVFEKKKVELDCKDEGECCIVSYPSDFYQMLNQKAIACKEGCEKDKTIDIDIIQSDDIYNSRRNTYTKSDFAFEKLLADEGEEGLYVYHDGEMEVKKVVIDYYRKPKEIHAPSLVKCDDGSYYDYCGRRISEDQDLEVEGTFASRQITNIAVLLAQGANKDLQGFQVSLQKILQVENF